MPRIACLRIPKFQIIVQQKYEQLKGLPFALIKGKLTTSGYSRARIFMCNKEADQYNIIPDMRLAEAKAQCAELILREQDQILYQTAQKELIASLITCSPKIKTLAMGIILLDASGLSLQGGESSFCHNILKLCSKTGFNDCYIGIADSAFAAEVASKINKRRINIIKSKEDKNFLFPLSIRFLKLTEEIENTLFTLGISTLGKLASIPVGELNKRFGNYGEINWKPWELAQGIDNSCPALPAIEKTYECFLDLGSAVSQFNELTFALKSMLDKLTNDLKQNGLCVQEMILSFYNDTNKFDERILPLICPTNKSKFLLELIRLSLNAKPLLRELTAINLKISRFTEESWQQNNISKNDNINKVTDNKKKEEAKTLLLQRFAARIGKNVIFKAEANDQYLSENAGVWIAINDNSPKQNLLAVDLKFLQERNQITINDYLVLRSAAIPVFVQFNEGRPKALNYKKQWYKINSISTPEYLVCQWWNNTIAKDYYKILIEPLSSNKFEAQSKGGDSSINNNQLMLLTHDKIKDFWCIEGIYD